MASTSNIPASEQAAKEALIVVSNRLPFVLVRKENGNLARKFRYARERKLFRYIIFYRIFILLTKSAGGLVTAVAPVVARCSGLWVGWPGIFLSEDEKEPEIPESDSGHDTPTAGLLSKQASPPNVIEKLTL